ncbi:hypothetical protein DNTS_007853 [Danionella cerebrum]|uniref:Sestrin 2 n=1 Tax=Danionella cerebrum TaxID=2873325 RepID=A0A553RG13_9TELE|nr:hypothetical protein DNTS_007853 [Danionella translucida]
MKEDAGVDVPEAWSSGPSAFIQVEEMLEELGTQEVMPEPVVSEGRADHINMLMGLHPAYHTCFLRTQHALLQLDGPLPLPWRHYIIILASARHQCLYLVQHHRSAFLLSGGEASWLRGLHCAPVKLQRLQTINKLLAHRPWIITHEHIQELVCPGAEGRWSLAELIQAVVLMSHAHALASFVWGCGINPEPVPPEDPSIQSPQSPSESGGTIRDRNRNTAEWSEAVQEVKLLVERMKMVQQRDEEFTQEEMLTRFERERTESLLEPASGRNTLGYQRGSASIWIRLLLSCVLLTVLPVQRSVLPDCVSRFVEDADFTYQDFSPRGVQAPPTMRAQDYSWEDHGFSLMNRLYGEMAQLLDEKFQVVCALTYHTMAMHTNVDTSTLRKAIWNYIHCIYGIRYDDYNYGEVNQLLERSLKLYVKTVACHPEKTTAMLFFSFWRHFRHSEKVHMNLLLMEARLQAALLYALRAITRYMT